MALNVARHNDMLSFNQLIAGSKKLLSSAGMLCVIIPFPGRVEFVECARQACFYLRQETIVAPKSGRDPKRVLLEFSLQPAYPVTNNLAILDEKGCYTEDYKTLTSQFYIAF
jgi:tRNA1Val (adenine37-N6)-methyltransferase